MKDGLKPCKWLKFMSKLFKKCFQMDNYLLDRMGYRRHFLHQIVATPQNLWYKKQGCSLFYPLALYLKNGQNDHFHEGGKVGRSNVTLIFL